MRALFVVICSGGLTALIGCGKPAPPAAAVVPDAEPPPIPGGQTFESPVYKLWAKFPVGSRVVQRTTTENEDNKTEKTVTTISYTLKQKTDEFIVVESQATTTHYTGRVETNPASETKTRKMFSLPPGVKQPEPKKAEEGAENLTVAGKSYKATWTREKGFTEAGDSFTQTWSSDEVPGGLLRSVSKVPSKKATITVEVTEIAIP
ncbi:hypothetical protein GobsT_45590 [Gemmata obscuriglobus]|uniref:Uncharacterized protein n=1 Tax=Gemmata obscuriglobus TaxID=114 RepID=A0A2Z3GZJ1_9BACT|nr:hypothetical protein [Gemmata obscuriglobus]AWM37472.1 hypothetical protein C1280_10895 [Gemmata obscuriglobus]QEG29761.1 hypothetical protein GobsT_45590 [Gemmata obscuriglobus]VTS09078.1 Uncharacterized protein OS=Singulisphaera acidiphila (strain ATCC BAA-1392 / DSM 18658 / VKM B-2454 / MOB10) GN=Sinac_0193 PE=4 SV=1 [Gemmata obscuriglobus UQM 2246]